MEERRTGRRTSWQRMSHNFCFLATSMPSLRNFFSTVLPLFLLVTTAAAAVNKVALATEPKFVSLEEVSPVCTSFEKTNSTFTMLPAPPSVDDVDDDGYLDTGFGIPQIMTGGEDPMDETTMERAQKMHNYMHHEVLQNPEFELDTLECLLRKEYCAYWAATGECKNNPEFMTLKCAPACFSCEQYFLEMNGPIQIPALLSVDEDGYLDTGFGEMQILIDTETDQTIERIQIMYEYLYGEVLKDPKYDAVVDDCLLRNDHCVYWAVIGECEANPEFMALQCAPACFCCDQLAFETRCPMTNLPPNIWEPGDLDHMFEQIITDEYYKANYKPRLILQPGMQAGSRDAPWVIIVDDFLMGEECDTLIQLGGQQGYEESLEIGEKQSDGTYADYHSEFRTSTNAWCMGACLVDEVTQGIFQKIENLTAIPDSHSEHLQLLKYEEQQFYGQHHDYIEYELDRAQGVRIVTVFLYLNDVEEGGGTRFPTLDVTVQAKRGRALIWPSVRNDNPHQKDIRTEHEALPVIKGIKYGANAWLHQRDFKMPFDDDCV